MNTVLHHQSGNCNMDLENFKEIKKEDNGLKDRGIQLSNKFKDYVKSFGKKIKATGQEDPRRIVHSLKVGLALCLVSIFYFIRPLFDSVGGNAIWAVMTVVVVFEFSVGATLSKGLNRSCATLLAGLLGVGVSYAAEVAGDRYERVILSISVFVLGSCCTFSRFIPNIKERYDYGVVIFILTFNLVAISGYRVQNIIKLAHQRLATILIGCALCFILNAFLFPIWAGDDLHGSTVENLKGLAASLEGCVVKYFEDSESREKMTDTDEDGLSNGYKHILNSKSAEESLANFARWEIPHGKFRFGHPWKHYTKIGSKLRYCAYTVEALYGLLNSENQAPYSLRETLQWQCMEITNEVTGILRELAESIKTMTMTVNVDARTLNLYSKVNALHHSLMAQPELFIDSRRWDVMQKVEMNDEESCEIKKYEEEGNKVIKERSYALMEALPLASFCSLLIECSARLESIVKEVSELANEACFNKLDAMVNVELHTPNTSFLSIHQKNKVAPSLQDSNPESPQSLGQKA